MSSSIHIPLHHFERVPVVLLGGVNLIRSLGLAGIPVVVASFERRRACVRVALLRRTLPPPRRTGRCSDRRDRADRRSARVAARPARAAHVRKRRLPRAHLHASRAAATLLPADAERSRRGRCAPREGCVPVVRAAPRPAGSARARLGHRRARAGPGRGEAVRQGRLATLGVVRRRFRRCESARLRHPAPRPRPIASLAPYRAQLTCQQYVPGDDTCIWSFHGFADEHGVVLDSFIGRKLRTYPRAHRRKPFIELDDDDALAALGSEIAVAPAVEGHLQDGFQEDPRDRPLVPARDQRPLQPLALPRRLQRRESPFGRVRVPPRGHAPAAPARLRHRLPLALVRAGRAAWRSFRRAASWASRRGSPRSSSRATSTTSSRGATPGPWIDVWMRRFARLSKRPPGVSSIGGGNGDLRRPRRYPRQPRSARGHARRARRTRHRTPALRGRPRRLQRGSRWLRRALARRGAQSIAGNHDLIGTGALGFERCSNKAMHSLKRTRAVLGEETAAYLRALPSHRVLEDTFSSRTAACATCSST